jgi:hypothetical protein
MTQLGGWPDLNFSGICTGLSVGLGFADTAYGLSRSRIFDEVIRPGKFGRELIYVKSRKPSLIRWLRELEI